MTVINSLGVNALSIRGAGTDYHRLSRVYESLAEANADSGFSATAGVEHVALIKGIGLAFYNHSTSQWEHTATELEANVDDLISLAGVGENTANLGTFSGSTIADNQTIKQALQTIETTLEAIDLDTDDMAALTGLAENVTNLGTFTGSTISDSSTVKTALQALETSLETMSPSATVTEIDGNVDDLISLTGIAENTTNLGTFSGSTIADSVTVKAALQALETALELKAASSTVTEVDGNVDDVISVLGVAENVTHLGTFSGSTISDSQTIKQALQALETALELKAASTTVSEIDGNVDDLVTLTGMAENSSDLGTFAGSIIADNVTVKQALQSLETLLQDTDGNTDSLIALTGITENVSHLGTFTGSTITDSTTVKAALQELETSTELKFDKAGGTLTGNVTVSKSFPDFQLASNDEKRLLFADAGGAGTAALKHTSTTLDFFVGGIASGNKEMSLGTDGLDVTALKIDGTAITATATELNYVDGVSSAIQTQLDSKLAISGAAAALHLDDLLTAVGIASEGLHLGTFLGSTISDNTTVKSALQELELSNELKATIASPAFTGQHITHTAGDTQPTTHKIIGGFPDFILQTNQGDFATHQNEGRLLFHDAGAGGVAAIKQGLKDTEPMRFFTGGIDATDEQMRINANGRVGIGTTDPQSLLHVEGSIVAKADFPDVSLRSGGERRVLFADAGGSAEGGIKFASNTFKIFAGGGIASGNEAIACNGTTIETKDDLVQNPGSSVTPAENGELVVEATNNTTLTFKLKGSDGTVRSGTITLS